MKNTMMESLKKLSQGQGNVTWAALFGRGRYEREVLRQEEEAMGRKEVEGQRPEVKGLDYKAMRALVERCVKRGWVQRAVAKKSRREDGAQGAKKQSSLKKAGGMGRRTKSRTRTRTKDEEGGKPRSKAMGGSRAGREMGAQLDRQDACPTTEVGA